MVCKILTQGPLAFFMPGKPNYDILFCEPLSDKKMRQQQIMQNPPIESPKALLWTRFVTQQLFGAPVVFVSVVLLI